MLKNKNAILLIVGTIIISGCANFFNKFGLEAVGKNSYQYTTLKNLLAAIILSLILLARPKIIAQLKEIKKLDWLKLLLVGLIGGSIPFLLYFQGLSLTTAVSASFIHKTLFVWVGFMAWPILKESFTRWQIAAFLALIAGNQVFDGFKYMNFGYAELLILGAVIMWAVENVIAKIILKDIDSGVLAWARMFFGSIILTAYLFFTNNLSGLFANSVGQWGWLILVGVLLAGYNLAWYGALKKLPATVVSSALVLASPLTALLSAIFVSHKWTPEKTAGLIIISIAVIVMLLAGKNKKYADHAIQPA